MDILTEIRIQVVREIRQQLIDENDTERLKKLEQICLRDGIKLE